MKSIKILGAGISGLTAAINLAKAGYKVDVYERNKDVGMRFGGDFQGLENWSEKEDILESFKKMNIKINFDYYPSLKISLAGEVNLDKNVYYLVKRGNSEGSIDCGLKTQALEAGAIIHFNETFAVEKVDIVATGPILSEVFAIAKGIVFNTKSKDLSVSLINDDASFKGYSYLLIEKGHGCMFSVVFGEFKRINECFKKTMEIFCKTNKFDIINPKNIGGVGCFSTKNIFKKDNNLFVGEAAGLQDMLWGFGMRYAVVSGFLAAQSIIHNQDYEKLAKDHFDKKLKASLVNRFMWEIGGFGKHSFLVDKVKQKHNLLDLLYSFHNYNLFQKIIYPFALLYIRRKYSNLKL